MSELRKLATAKAPMYLDDRSPEGHIIVCTGGGSEHSFLRHHLGLSVECPICGQVSTVCGSDHCLLWALA
jgi:hypothetical protein